MTTGKATEKNRAAKEGSSKARLEIRLVKSGICTPKDHKATLKGIGFRRMGEELTRIDTPSLRGMLRKVRHLVEVETAK